MEEGLGVAADEGERRAQLVADGRDEPLAQLLEGLHGADVAQDRRRPRVAAVAAPAAVDGVAARRPGPGDAGLPRTAVSR